MSDFQDIANELFIMNNITVERLFALGTDAFMLYSFYYKTAKWQNTTAPWATNEYVMTKLNWGRPRVVRTKKILEDNGFIKQIKITDATGKIKNWAIKLCYLQNQTTSQKTTEQFLPPVAVQDTYTNNNIIELKNNINTNNNNTILSSKPDDFDARVVELWNSIAEKYKLAKVSMITPARHKALLARMKEHHFATPEELFDRIRQAIKESMLLKGRELVETPYGPEIRNKSWRPSFDFFICQPSSLLKALEGAYADPDLVR